MFIPITKLNSCNTNIFINKVDEKAFDVLPLNHKAQMLQIPTEWPQIPNPLAFKTLDNDTCSATNSHNSSDNENNYDIFDMANIALVHKVLKAIQSTIHSIFITSVAVYTNAIQFYRY